MQYIAYRLRVAGGRRKVRFTSGAVRTVYKLSFGVPRVINAICDRALLIGYTMEQADITPAIIRKASKEIRGEHFRSKAKEFWKGLLPSKTFVGAAALIILAGFVLVNPSGERLLDILEQALAKPAESTSAPVNNTVAAAIPDTTTPPAALTTTTPPAPEETIPEIKTFADSLALADPSEMRNTALGALMQAWNLALLGGFPEGDEPKQIESFAKQNGLVFEPVKPTLDQLAAINLPALVQLNANGKPMWAGLLGIEGDQFRIATSPGQTAMVPKAELEPLYAKQAIILWVDPTPTESILKRSMRGGNVEALQAHLQTIGLLGNSPNGVYDDATAEAVRKLQAQCGLSVDGVAGRQTRMVLSSWLPLSDGPQLMEGPVLAAQVTAPAPASPPPVPVVDGPVVLDTPAPEKAATPQEPAPSVDTPVVPDAAPAAKTEPAPEPKVDAPVAPETEAKPAEEVKPVEEAKPENAEPPTTDAPAPEAPAPAPEAPKGVDTPPADEAPAVEVQDLPEPGATPPAPVDESGNDGSRGGPLTVKVDPPAAPIAEGDAADSTTGEGAPR